jgi:hypothetical protein
MHESDPNIQKKIERMQKKEYLLHEKLANGNYLYSINEDKEFIFTHPPPEPLPIQREMQAIDLISHTNKLKEAIHAWIDNFSQPNIGFAGAGNSSESVISNCENHLLFQDLINHLPGLGLNVCEKWHEYKYELLRLEEHKKHLYTSLKDEVLKCFVGLELHFVFDGEHRLEDYECYLNSQLLYSVVANLEHDYEGFHKYEMLLSWLECNAPIVEKGNHVLWGETISYMRVPIEDRALMDAGVPRFLVFLRDIQHSEYMGIAADIIKKVEALKAKRIAILRDLERALLYANFPGACQYLK